MLKNEKLMNKSSSVDQPSHKSSNKVIRDGVATNRQRSRILIKTSNTPSLELERNLPERYTPYTSLSDYFPDILENCNPRQPDLTLKCKKCSNYIKLDDLSDHAEFHSAVAYFNFNDINSLTLDELNSKRTESVKVILNKSLRKSTKDLSLNNNKTCEWRSKLHQLNYYYELLKSYIGNRFESTRQLKPKNLRLNSKGQSLIGLNDLIVSIGLCSNMNSNHRIQMEDSNTILDNFGDNRNLVYIGVFDGYDGEIASRKCSSQLHLSVLDHIEKSIGDVKFNKEAFEFDEINHLERYEKEEAEAEAEETPQNQEEEWKNDPIDRVYRQSLRRAYRYMDILLARGKGESSKVRWSGATSCTCVLVKTEEGGFLHVANCGDVEAIVVYDSSKITPNYLKRNYKLLTKLHTINSCLKDRDYIERKGCNILETSMGEKKICGLYSITRGLGFHGDKQVKKFISAKPSVSTYKLESHYSALIIATKGLWSVLSYEQVAELVIQSLPSSEKKFKYERSVSPSIRALVTSNKEKLTDRSNLLHTVHDKEEVGEMGATMERCNESSETSIESNTIKKTYSAVDDESDSSDKATNQQQENAEINKRRSRTQPSSPREKLDKRTCYSDVYPYRIQNPIMTEIEDDRLDLVSVEKINLRRESAAQEANKAQDEVKAAVKLNSLHVVQVDEYEMSKFERANMENSETARRLDLAESLSEMLANVALLAGSTDNITVNCILLPGAFTS